MSSFSLWGGLGGPKEACVKCGGNETTLRAHAPTRGGFVKKVNLFEMPLRLGSVLLLQCTIA
jgi:hypothetical protein